MSAFLAWLYARISYVQTWFGGQFGSYLQTVTNTWSWIVAKTTEVYNNAVTLISSRITMVSGWLDSLESWAIQQFNGVRSYVYNLVAAINSDLSDVYDWATGNLNSAIAALRTQLTNVINADISELRSWINVQLADIGDSLIAPFAWLLTIRERLELLATTLTPDFLTNLRSLVDTSLANIRTFFADPAGFVLSILWPRVIEYGSYAIAYALGTTQETLPPLPAWGSSPSAGGSVIDYPSGTPGSGLVNPLIHMYVSGYVYGPNHHGTDFGITDGQPIYAAHAGTVGDAGWVDYGFGFTVTINSSSYWSRYGHLKQVLVMSGQHVDAGQMIAYGNSTGNSTGPHLHFELKINGAYVDPVLALGLGAG